MRGTDRGLIVAVVAFLVLGGLCVCCVAAVALVPYRWFGAASGPVGVAKAFIREDATVESELGGNLRFDAIPSGSVHEDGGGGRATLTLGTRGSKGRGKVRVELRKPPGGTWEVQAAELLVGGKHLPLKGEISEGPPESEGLPPEPFLPPAGAEPAPPPEGQGLPPPQPPKRPQPTPSRV